MKRTQYRLSGRQVLIGLVVILGAPVLAHAVYLYRALDTSPGQVESSPYRLGLAYNDRLAAIERQRHLGWRAELALARDASEPDLVIAEVSLIDRAGRGVAVGDVQGRFVHPMREAFDTPGPAAGEPGLGRYRFQGRLPKSGSWTFRFTASASDGTPYRRDFEVRVVP